MYKKVKRVYLCMFCTTIMLQWLYAPTSFAEIWSKHKLYSGLAVGYCEDLGYGSVLNYLTTAAPPNKDSIIKNVKSRKYEIVRRYTSFTAGRLRNASKPAHKKHRIQWHVYPRVSNYQEESQLNLYMTILYHLGFPSFILQIRILFT